MPQSTLLLTHQLDPLKNKLCLLKKRRSNDINQATGKIIHPYCIWLSIKVNFWACITQHILNLYLYLFRFPYMQSALVSMYAMCSAQTILLLKINSWVLHVHGRNSRVTTFFPYTVCLKKNVTLTKMKIKMLLIEIPTQLLMKLKVKYVG
jgi:hypothetical protein